MTMGNAWSRIESSNDDIRLEAANCPNDIGQDLFFIPILKGFRWVLAVSKIKSTGEILLASIYFPSLDQFLSSYLPQFNSQFLADEVLSPIASGEAQVRHFSMLPIGQVSDHTGIFIVWVCSYVQYPFGFPQFQQLMVELRGRKGLPKT